MLVRIAGITKESVVDGPGIRMVVFAQGCPHRCPGCHNPNTHDPHAGIEMDTGELFDTIKSARLVRGVTFSGGEPFMQARALSGLARRIKEATSLDIVTYTGFVFEHLLVMAAKKKPVRELLEATDLLIDGPYRAEQRNLGLTFRGSANQRLIDIPRTLSGGEVVLWEDPAAMEKWAWKRA